jgi:type I restriction enzyme S subunit
LDLLEQRRVAGRLDEISTLTYRLETIARRKLEALTDLKQSLLQKAFSGELTAQPEQALRNVAA